MGLLGPFLRSFIYESILRQKEYLMQSSDTNETQVAHTSTNPPKQQPVERASSGRVSRWLSKGAAILVIAIIVGASLILFTSRQPSATGSATHGSPAISPTPVTPH